MRKIKESFVAWLLVVACASIGAGQQQGSVLEDPPWIKEVAPPRVVYSVPGMETIKAQKDLTYKRVGDAELKMDVYAPPNLSSGARRPVVLFIHGGAIPPNLRTKPKEWGVFVSYGQLAAATGFVGITFNHRFYGWDRKALTDARADVSDAIAYIRDHAERLGVDKDRICLWSVSAGSLFLAQATGDAPPPAYIRCLVSYYPIMDLEPLRKERPAITDDAIKEFSPVNRLSGASNAFAPIFIGRAGREESGVNVAVDRFIQGSLKLNATIDLSNHPEGQHGFDTLDNTERTREIIKRTLEFIKAHS
ncbi:MAG: alpha/beta hydrolase [Pyrinomonadaceae bacterium]